MSWYVETHAIRKELCAYFLNVAAKCEKVVMYSNNKNEKRLFVKLQIERNVYTQMN